MRKPRTPAQIAKNRAQSKRWAAENPERQRELSALSYQKNKVKILCRQKELRRQKAEQIRQYHKKWRQKNYEKLRCQGREYAQRNMAKIVARNRKRREENRPKMRAYQNAKMRQYRQNPAFRISCYLRARIGKAIKGKTTKSSTIWQLLGCDIEWLMAWFEVHFQPGMSWQNYGPIWHADHIQPCASFDLTNPEDQKRCFHWTNLQPLWATDNWSKNKRPPKVLIPS